MSVPGKEMKKVKCVHEEQTTHLQVRGHVHPKENNCRVLLNVTVASLPSISIALSTGTLAASAKSPKNKTVRIFIPGENL